MEMIYVVLALVQSFGVSLGVGASTLAVLNYIVASKDGTVDESERRLMHLVYTVLRVSMGIILVTMFIQGLMLVSSYGVSYFHPFVAFAWTVLVMLYVNAILMTKRVMPRAVGPALQAGSWYMLAFLYFLSTISATNYTYTQFLMWYIALIVVMMVLINGSLAYFKSRIAA